MTGRQGKQRLGVEGSPWKRPVSRRRFLAAGAGAGSALLLPACLAGGQSGTGGATESAGGLSMQSIYSDPGTKPAFEETISSYGEEIDINSVDAQSLQTQIPNYLASEDPPDVLTFFSGNIMFEFAERNLLLDVSSAWEEVGSSFPNQFKELSSLNGRQYLMPLHWYWWGVFHRKSVFEKNGYEQPTDWDGFISLCKRMRADGLVPIAIGTNQTPFEATGWFDYLDLRINGYDFHKSLLAGEESWKGDEVAAVFDAFRQVVPYFLEDSSAFQFEQAVSELVKGDAGMILCGAFLFGVIPESLRSDIDFFAFPTIERSVQPAEEAPLDGFIIAAGSDNTDGALDLVTYLGGAEAQEVWIKGTGGTTWVAANTEVPRDLYPSVSQKGIDLVTSTENITQFFNRDSNDAMSLTAYSLIQRFIEEPQTEIKPLLGQLERKADQVLR